MVLFGCWPGAGVYDVSVLDPSLLLIFYTYTGDKEVGTQYAYCIIRRPCLLFKSITYCSSHVTWLTTNRLQHGMGLIATQGTSMLI
jgi:hypothetical protein